MKTSYEHLVALCALPPDFTASTPQHDPRTARVRYLVQALTEMGAVFDEDCFDASGQNRPADDIPRFVNLMALVPAGNLRSTRSVIFVAHHDVHTPHYQNANDNSASCANLLELLERLMADVPPYHRTYIVFTDAEEIVSYSRSGARRLVDRIHEGYFGDVTCCINLELTGVGTALYCDGEVPGIAAAAGTPVSIISTPFNDATVLRHFGIPATVIGTLPPIELAQRMRQHGPCPTWGRCHQANDTLEQLSAADMADFVQVLERLARNS